jgi:hypothetical protein
LDFSGMTAAAGWARRGVLVYDGVDDKAYRGWMNGIRLDTTSRITALTFTALPWTATDQGYLYVYIEDDWDGLGTDRIRLYKDPGLAAGDEVARADATGVNGNWTAQNGSGIAGTVTCQTVPGDITTIYIVTPQAYFAGHGMLEVVFRSTQDAATGDAKVIGVEKRPIWGGTNLTRVITCDAAADELAGWFTDGTNSNNCSVGGARLGEWQRACMIWVAGSINQIRLIRMARDGSIGNQIQNAGLVDLSQFPCHADTQFFLGDSLAAHQFKGTIALARVWRFGTEAIARYFFDYGNSDFPIQKLLQAQDALVEGV